MAVALDTSTPYFPLDRDTRVQLLDTPKKVEVINYHHDNLAGTIQKVFTKATGQNEDRVLEYTQKLEDDTKKAEKLSKLRQELRTIITEFKVDWSNDPVKRELIDTCKSYGVSIPEDGYVITKENAKIISDNTEEVSNAITSQNKKNNMHITWLQDISQTLYSIWAKLIESLGEIMKTIARMGR